MKILTLEECKSRAKKDFYLAVVKVSDFREEKRVFTDSKQGVVIDFKTRTIINKKAPTVKILSKEYTGATSTVIVVKIGNIYQNLSWEEVEFFTEDDILYIEPLSNYYNVCDYIFVMYKGRPAISLKSMEGIDRFSDVYEKKSRRKPILSFVPPTKT